MVLKWGLWLGKATKEKSHWSVNVMDMTSRDIKLSWTRARNSSSVCLCMLAGRRWLGSRWCLELDGQPVMQQLHLWRRVCKEWQECGASSGFGTGSAGTCKFPSHLFHGFVALSKSHTFSLPPSLPPVGSMLLEAGGVLQRCSYVTAQK